ncbi:hypothetical protein Celaphus_00018787 [Cervus elaphus hippelaphus]|uniref:E3 ubiquitin-protein ligase n=1 Tax=Cervus elaphus hippelaphus TaxID=46360 RepID=A0A212C5T8_CEREH|nr:hypothetical protein Celaphus_00018787 [Cervus elaphus hippelaphus]
MAGCGEIDHSINMLPTNRKANESCPNTAPSLTVPECAICLQTCVHPVSLPCKHVFCYLCVKGASWLGKRCALCRQEIPEDFLDKPTLLSPEELKAASRGNGEYAWYYEGRNGWWQYDERTSRELEDAFSKGKKSTEMLIAGFLYVADLENMVQYRRNEHGRRRKIKRDIIDIPKKGVAGLRLDCDANTVNLARESSADGADSVPAQSGASVQSSSVRPLTMAGCGEIDHSINMLPTNRKANESCPNTAPSLTVPECAICLQTCVHPVSLPCKHVFCYLCVKGASWLGKRCALCRQEIPEDFLDKPTLLSPEELKAASRGNGEYAWYYEGRNGWWQYDERTSRELEDAFSKGKKSTEMLIAGFLYVADLENMVQYRRNEHGRRRKIKRDIIDIPKKGVAGLRLDCDANTVNLARESSADGADSVPAQSGASVQSSSVRPLTSVDGQLTSPATPSPDASTSLEDSFAHLQLSGDSIAERSHRGVGEEEHESPSSGRVPAPDTSIEETESYASSDSEDVSALVAQHSLTQQRLLVPNPNQTVSDRSGTDRSVAAGGTVSVRSRRPDGQCTVTEV